MKRLIAPAFALFSFLGLMVFVPSVTAAPTIDINFSGDTPGTPPSTLLSPPSGETIAQPNMLSTPGAFSVTQDYTRGAASIAGRSVVFQVVKEGTEPAVGGSLNIWSHIDDYVLEQDYSFKADVIFNSEYGNLGASSLMINVFNSAYNYTGYQAQVYFSDGRVILSSNGEQKIFHNAWSGDELVSLEIRMLYSSSMAQVLINDRLVGEVELNISGERGVYGIQLLNADTMNSNFEVAIGNIRGEAIPEPATASVVVLGSLMLLASKRLWTGAGAGSK